MNVNQDSKMLIKHYRYKRVDLSLLSNIFFNPFANNLASFFPKGFNISILPRIGIISLLTSYIISISFTVTWISFFAHGLAMTIFQVFNLINLKIDQRDNSYTPMSFLERHMYNQMASCLITLTFCSIIQLPINIEWLIYPIASVIPLYCKYINFYCTDIMQLQRINPVDEGIFMLQILCWISCFYPSIWSKQIYYYQIKVLFAFIIGIISILYSLKSIIESIRNINNRFSIKNYVPIIVSVFILIQYFVIIPNLFTFSLLVRFLQWSFLLFHTLIISKILIQYLGGQKLRLVFFRLLLFASSNIMVCMLVYIAGFQDQLVVWGLLDVATFVLGIAYSVLQIINIFEEFHDITLN